MFDKASSVIKDASKLTFDYVPVDLINRETEMSMLEMLMRPVVENASSETAFVTGNVGAGKTATVKRFCMNMADYCGRNNIPFGYVLVNCRQRNTDSSVLIQLIRYFDPEFPDKGFAPADMLQILRRHIVKSHKRFLIVLDEADSLIQRGSTDLIYQFTRFSDAETTRVSLSLILISQQYMMDRLDTASISTFKRSNTVRFRRYTKEDLRTIVESRAKMAIIDGCYEEDILDFIADIASETSDARCAIELLDRSARIAESRGASAITGEDVRESKNMMIGLVDAEKLVALGKSRLLVLLAIARCIRHKVYVTMAAAEKTYAVVCEEYEVEAKKHTRVWSLVTELEKKGMIKTFKRTEPGERGGAVLYISLPDIPAEMLAKKIEIVLEELSDEL